MDFQTMFNLEIYNTILSVLTLLSACFVIILLIFYFICLFLKFKKNKGKVVDKYSFWMFITILLSGVLVLLFANKSSTECDIKGLFDSVYSSLKLFYADGTAKFFLENKTANTAYQILYYFIVFLAPFTLVSTVLSYFDNSFNRWKLKRYARHTKKNIIIFSELNHQNLEIVRNFKKPQLKAPEEPKKVDLNEVPNAFFNHNAFYQLEIKNKNYFVFCDVYKENNENSTELVDLAHEEGCILLKEDIVSVHKHIRDTLEKKCNKKLIRYFISGVDETENVRQAVEIAETEQAIKISKSESKKDTRLKNLAIITFTEGESNGRILEALNKEKGVFVLRIKPSLLTAIDILTNEENWLIKEEKKKEPTVEATDEAIKEATETTNEFDKEKDLKVLVLGVGRFGFEIGKFLSWYYQREKGNISIHFVDKDTDIKNRLYGSYRDFFEYKPDLDKRDQDACFNCKLHEGVDVFSESFTALLNNIYKNGDAAGIDAVYCALGDDTTNVEAALHVRKLIDRINHEKLSAINLEYIDNHSEKIANLIAVKKQEIEQKTNVNDSEKAEKAQDDIYCETIRALKEEYSTKINTITNQTKIFSLVHSNKIKDSINKSTGFIKDCNINIVGADSSVYGYNNIFNHDIEANYVRKRDKDLLRYNSSEYNRLSSISETLHYTYIESLYPKIIGDENYNELRRKIGNKRWNAYMLSIGYTHFPEQNEKRELLFGIDQYMKDAPEFPERKWHRGGWHNSIVPYDKLPEEEQRNNYTE